MGPADKLSSKQFMELKLKDQENSVKKARIWATALIICLIVICVSVLILNWHPYVIRFEMDNNTLQAVKAINWTELHP